MAGFDDLHSVTSSTEQTGINADATIRRNQWCDFARAVFFVPICEFDRFRRLLLRLARICESASR